MRAAPGKERVGIDRGALPPFLTRLHAVDGEMQVRSFGVGVARVADATDQLAAATALPLVPPCVTEARKALARFGGTAKTTGAGGGDVAIGVIPATPKVVEDRNLAERLLIEAGCQPLGLTVDTTGVDLQPAAQ